MSKSVFGIKFGKFLAIAILMAANASAMGKIIFTVGPAGCPLSLSADTAYYLGGPFVNGDSVRLNSQNQYVIADVAGAIIDQLIIGTGYGNRVWFVPSKNVTMGDSISGPNNASRGIIQWSDAAALTLNGTVYNNMATIDFNNVAGVLNLNTSTTFTQSFTNAQLGTMNINGNVTVTNQNAFSIQTINIGQAGIPTNFTLQSTDENVDILSSAGSSIHFLNPSSKLVIIAPQNQSVTLSNALDPGENGYGIVELSTSNAGNILTVTGSSIGTTTHHLHNLVLSGNNSTFAIQSAIYANNLTTNGVINLNSNLVGHINEISLGTSSVTYTGNANFMGALTVDSIYDSSVGTGGQIVVNNGSTLDLSALSSMNIILTPLGSDISTVENATYNVFLSPSDGIVPFATPTLDDSAEGNEFVRWYIANNDAHSLTLKAKDIANEVIEDIIEELESDHSTGDEESSFASLQNRTYMSQLLNVPDNGLTYASKFKNNIGYLAVHDNLRPLKNMFDHLLDRSTRSSAIQDSQMIPALNNAISQSIHSAVSGRATALSSGDYSDNDAVGNTLHQHKYGVWVQPFARRSKQTVNNTSLEYLVGYKTKSSGVTVGFDTQVSDALMLGLAYTGVQTKVKLQNQKIGDAIKMRSNLLTLYGSYNLDNNWFASAIASIGSTTNKSHETRLIAVGHLITAPEIASAKYKSSIYTGQISLGYNYLLKNQFKLTPSIGVTYSHLKDNGYRESGTKFQNLLVHKKSYDLVLMSASVRAAKDIHLTKSVLTPSIYGTLYYDTNNKTPAIDARLDGINAPLPTKPFKRARTRFNLGATLTAKHDIFEYGIDFNTTLANRYFSQQGSIKLRIKV